MGFKRSIGLLLLTGLGCQASSSSSGGKSVLPGVDAVVFAKRAYVTKEGTHDVAGGAGQVIDYLRYDPGGGVFVLDPPAPGGKLTNLTSGFKDVDISGLDLSFDAKEVVFSMRHGNDDGQYHIYKAKLDGTRV